MSGVAVIGFVSDFWQHQLVEHNRHGLFLVLVGFLGSFGFIRMSTRIMRSPRFQWWPGSVVSDSGVHLHHLVFGIALMIGAGCLGFGIFDTSPFLELAALAFGIGVGLTVDEFALWVHLDDVYWSEEGRSSVDAAVVAVAGMLLVLVGVRPFDFATGSAEIILGSAAALLLHLIAVLVCFGKGRMLHGVIGLFVSPVAIYGALRLGKPGYAWARRFYGERNPGKQARAEARFAPDRRTERWKEDFRTLVGGETEAQYEAKLAEHRATAQAAAAVRERAEQASR